MSASYILGTMLVLRQDRGQCHGPYISVGGKEQKIEREREEEGPEEREEKTKQKQINKY